LRNPNKFEKNIEKISFFCLGADTNKPPSFEGGQSGKMDIL
jgi:hypothetical protein